MIANPNRLVRHGVALIVRCAGSQRIHPNVLLRKVIGGQKTREVAAAILAE
jgi:hypothetical protein